MAQEQVELAPLNRYYPTNAPRGGNTTLTGAGSINDIFTFPDPVQVVVQNDTAATIYVSTGNSQATQGDEALAAGAKLTTGDTSEYVAIYGAATTHVNGTAASGIVIYGVA